MFPDIASSISESVGCGLLASSAEAALDDFEVEPGPLDLGASHRRADRLNRSDLGGAHAVDEGDTGTGRSAVDMHRAGATQRHAAAELRARHAEHVAQHPEQRRVAVDIDAVRAAVDFDGEGHGMLSFCGSAARA